MALAGKSAQSLQEASGIPSDMIHRSLIRIGTDHNKAKGKQRKIESLVIDENSAVVVDEASMCGTRLLGQIVNVCRERGAKLVLIGDSKQLQSVDMGGAFYGLGQRLGAARLVEITRQKDEWARGAVEAFSEGRAAEGLGEYVSRGLVSVSKDREAAMNILISNWRVEGTKDPANNQILAPIHLEVSALNKAAQDARKEAGELGRKFTRLDELKIHENDRILFTKNARQLGVRNGHLATVESVSVLSKLIAARLDGGKRLLSHSTITRM